MAKYIVVLELPEVPEGQGDSDWPADNLREARALVAQILDGTLCADVPKPLGTVVSIAIPDEDTKESWTKVRKSKTYKSGWKYEPR